ncbi:hypothetical protein [Actinomyces wuliandei]|uniref:hypothetical protein n=1 Tax=Actinomyces wuliandei TaxID=2057743 RepID=UPI001C5A0ED9|nr:hypothetical protein [Actinomyces wuliandei]
MRPAPRPRRAPVSLDDLRAAATVPRTTSTDPTVPSTRNTSTASDTSGASGVTMTTVTFRVPTDLAGRARTAYRVQMGSLDGTWAKSFDEWGTQALEAHVRAAEARHNSGRPFPPTPAGSLPAGRSRLGHP